MNIVILIVVVAIGVLFLGVLVGVGLLQCYLAKYQYQSPFYWRQVPYLSNIVFVVGHNKLLRLVSGALKVFSVADFNAKQWCVGLCSIVSFFRLQTIMERLDDRLDTSLPQDILALGDATLGPQLSPFLNRFLSPRDVQDLNYFVMKGLITSPELYSFWNLLAFKAHRQALLTLEYNEEPCVEKKALIREKMAQENLEIAGCCCAIFVHFVRKDSRIGEIISDNKGHGLTYDDLKKVYPSPARSGELMQVLHDTLEFRLDLREERTIGKISANYFLARLEKQGDYDAIQNSITPLPNRVVNFYELPEAVRKVFVTVQDEYIREVFHLGLLSGWINTLWWEYNYRVGFYLEKK